MNKRQLWSRLGTAAALALGLALRLWFIVHTARIAGDTLIYGEIARNWMQHGIYGFALTAGIPQPTLIRLPGYPLFLIACFRLFGPEHYTPILYLQALIDLLACLLISALAGRLFGPRARMAALWLSALCPFTASYVAAPLTETLTLACITVAFYALYRWQQTGPRFNRWLTIITITLAYSILLRPEQGLLSAAILPTMLWIALTKFRVPHPFAASSRKGGISTPSTPTNARVPHPFAASPRKGGISTPSTPTNARVPHPFAASPRKGGISTLNATRALNRTIPVLAAAICILLPLIPWTIRNQRTFHVVQPLAPRYAIDPGETAPVGFQRWFRTWAIDFTSTEDVYWNYDGAEIQISDLPNRAFDSDAQYTATEALLADYNETSNPTPALDARFTTLATQRIHADPIRYYITLPIARLLNMALRPRLEMLPIPLEWWKYREHPAQTLFSTAYATLNLIYLALATWGAILWHRKLKKDRLPRPTPPNLTASLSPSAGTTAPIFYAMLATIALRSALLLTLDNSEPRYTLEFFPILFLLAAIPFASPLQTPVISTEGEAKAERSQ